MTSGGATADQSRRSIAPPSRARASASADDSRFTLGSAAASTMGRGVIPPVTWPRFFAVPAPIPPAACAV